MRFPALILLGSLLCVSCARGTKAPVDKDAGSSMAGKGSVEVTARLVEIPEGAIFERDLYHYAAILKYQVLKVHRGSMKGEMIYVGQYDPTKPRSEAADRNAQGVGGNLKTFRAGQVQRMALEAPIDDFYMGGIVNKYFGKETDPIYWAVWTDLVSD